MSTHCWLLALAATAVVGFYAGAHYVDWRLCQVIRSLPKVGK